MKITTVLVLVLSSFSAFSMEFGNLVLVGNGCFGSTKLITVSAEEGRYAFPLRAKVNKKSGTNFDRKTCNLRLPISLSANEKVQLVNLSQVVRVVAFKGAEVKSSLTMGLVGRNGAPLNFDLKLTDEEYSVIENLKAHGVVAESECGKSAMLTGNLSILVTGSNTQAFVSTGTALITLKVIRCNQ
jgi:hypothetical protein